MRGEDLGEGEASAGAGGGEAVVAGEPDFSDGVRGAGSVIKPGAQVSAAPNALNELRRDEEGNERGGERRAGGRHHCFHDNGIGR